MASLFGMLICTTQQVKHTFYDWPDNDPAGAGIAYGNCSSRGFTAGGSGTFDDPLTFASAPGSFAVCEIVYDPYLRKYLRFEDYCAQWVTDWNVSGLWHVDVFVGSNQGGGGQDQIDCEIRLTTGDQTVIRMPRADLSMIVSEGLGRDDWIACADSMFTATELYQLGDMGCIGHVYTYDVADSCPS